MTDQQIQAIVDAAVADALAASGAKMAERPPKRIPIYNGVTGEAPPTSDGMVWPIDVEEWCSTAEVDGKPTRPLVAGHKGRYVRKKSEVRPAEEPAEESAGSNGGGEASDGLSLSELKELWQEAHPEENLPRENKPFFQDWATARA